MRLALCLLPFAVAPLAAQSLDSVCVAIRTIAVGQWAEYRMTGAGAEGVMRNQIVGTEPRGDTTLWWHESLAESADGQMIIRSLVPGYPFDTREVRQLIMKMGDEPAVRMPEHMLAMMRSSEGPGEPTFTSVDECARAVVVGWEAIDTPAGALTALHVRPAGSEGERIDLWLSLDVPFGVVRLTADDIEMLLVAYGADATSAIRESPREMP